MTRTLIHTSPLGPLSIPGVLGDPAPGEPFEVDDDIAESLLEQSELYAPAPETELTTKQLRAIAKDRGIDLAGARNKPDVIAAIARHDAPQTVGDVDEPPATGDPDGAADAPDTTEGGDQQ